MSAGAIHASTTTVTQTRGIKRKQACSNSEQSGGGSAAAASFSDAPIPLNVSTAGSTSINIRHKRFKQGKKSEKSATSISTIAAVSPSTTAVIALSTTPNNTAAAAAAALFSTAVPLLAAAAATSAAVSPSSAVPLASLYAALSITAAAAAAAASFSTAVPPVATAAAAAAAVSPSSAVPLVSISAALNNTTADAADAASTSLSVITTVPFQGWLLRGKHATFQSESGKWNGRVDVFTSENMQLGFVTFVHGVPTGPAQLCSGNSSAPMYPSFTRSLPFTCTQRYPCGRFFMCGELREGKWIGQVVVKRLSGEIKFYRQYNDVGRCVETLELRVGMSVEEAAKANIQAEKKRRSAMRKARATHYHRFNKTINTLGSVSSQMTMALHMASSATQPATMKRWTWRKECADKAIRALNTENDRQVSAFRKRNKSGGADAAAALLSEDSWLVYTPFILRIVKAVENKNDHELCDAIDYHHQVFAAKLQRWFRITQSHKLALRVIDVTGIIPDLFSIIMPMLGHAKWTIQRKWVSSQAAWQAAHTARAACVGRKELESGANQDIPD
jgi:hypothetical protein